MFVIIGLFFARRGCENYDQMKKTDFRFDKTTTGRRCIRYTKDELTKNHRENDVEKSSEGLIIETNTSKCPVAIFEQYLKRLNPENQFLWQRCRASFLIEDDVWYVNQKIGINKIKKFMHDISQFCGLSQLFTNHCLRVSSCTILGEKHSENDIKVISDHSSNSSLGIYKRIQDSKTEEMAIDLANALNSATIPLVMLDEADDKWLTDEVLKLENPACNGTQNVFNNCNVTINYNINKP